MPFDKCKYWWNVINRVTTNLTQPYRTLQPYQKTFFIKNLTEPYNSSYFIMTLQNLTEEVLWNFTHKERVILKKSPPAGGNQSLYVNTSKLFLVGPPARS